MHDNSPFPSVQPTDPSSTRGQSWSNTPLQRLQKGQHAYDIRPAPLTHLGQHAHSPFSSAQQTVHGNASFSSVQPTAPAPFPSAFSKSHQMGRNSFSPWGNRVQCQLCNKMGHSVKTCFYRFDKSFTGSDSFNTFNGSANVAEMEAFHATPESVADSSWYPDSGATNHLTPDESNLHSYTEYTGQQQIYMGNGKGLNIHNIGKSFIYLPSDSKNLVLNKL